MPDPHGLIRRFRYRDDVLVGDLIAVEMAPVEWFRLIGWGEGIQESLPREMSQIYTQVMQQVFHPTEIKEMVAHQQEHESNPLHGTPLEGLFQHFRFGPQGPEFTDPRDNPDEP